MRIASVRKLLSGRWGQTEIRVQKHISTGSIDTSRMFPTINKHRRLLSVQRDVRYCVINTHSSKILILINRCVPFKL